MPNSPMSSKSCRNAVPAIALLLPLTLIAMSNARVLTSMADLLDEQHHQQLYLPLWRSATGLAPSFSPFRSLPLPVFVAEPTDDEAAEEGAEDGTISMPTTASGEAKQKRRLVVRVPFAQNPDNLHLSRIYKSLFDPSQQSRAKKYESEGYGLRRFVPF